MTTINSVKIDTKIIRMGLAISRYLQKKYKPDQDDIDVNQLIEYCELYDLDSDSTSSIELSQISFSDEIMVEPVNIGNILKCPSFQSKYKIFIKVIYCLIKLNIPIFNVKKGNIFLKNVQTIRSNLYKERKRMLVELKEQIEEFISMYKNFDINDYLDLSKIFSIRIVIIDRILEIFQRLISGNILLESDTPCKIVSPHFYTKDTDYIEVYGEDN